MRSKGWPVSDWANEARALARDWAKCRTCGGDGREQIADSLTDEFGNLVRDSLYVPCRCDGGVRPGAVDALSSALRAAYERGLRDAEGVCREHASCFADENHGPGYFRGLEAQACADAIRAIPRG